MDAILAPAPPVAEFTHVIQAWLKRQEAQPAKVDDPIHGALFAEPMRPKGSEKTEMAAARCFDTFCRFAQHANAVYPDLDHFFVAWARWVISPHDLFPNDEQAAECLARRKQQAGEQFRVWTLPTISFRTYVNALARLFTREARGGQALQTVVPTSVKQFPHFCACMGELTTRLRGEQTTTWKSDPLDNTITTEEMVQVVSTVTDVRVLDVQRRNILCVGFATGFRSEVLRRLLVGSVHPGITTDGQRMYTFQVGTMKNMPGTLDHVDAKLFSQRVVESDEPLLCPIRAIDSQLRLVQEVDAAAGVQDPSQGFLFRTVRNFGITLGTLPTTEEMYRGVAAWVSSVIGRKLTFKDVARRAAISRLVNSGLMSIADCARYFRLHPHTIQVYHRATRDAPNRAAHILAKVKGERASQCKREGLEPAHQNVVVPIVPTAKRPRPMLKKYGFICHANSSFYVPFQGATGSNGRSTAAYGAHSTFGHCGTCCNGCNGR